MIINIGLVYNLPIVNSPFFFSPSYSFVTRVDYRVPLYVILCQIELRAFCSKHSDLQENRSILPLGGSIPVGSEFSEANDLPVKSEHSIKIGFGNGVLESDGNSDKLNHNDEPPNGGLSVGTISAQNMLVCGAAQPHNMGVAGRTNEKVDSSNSPSFALVLRKVFCTSLTYTVYSETIIL